MAEPSARPRDLEQEVEVVPAIRHEDAEWKIIQQNTFTRWVNNHLKKAGQSINNLETDFADGLRLISLAETLSHKSVGRHNKKVSFRSQRLENVSLALSFFQDKEGIKIINIDSTHIVDQNKKLILGLIWTLILHYSISMGWTAETKDGQPEETPKQKLLNWIRGRLPHGMPLSNFTSDWNDGLALGALVNTIIPGSVPNWDTWLPENALANTQKAMQAAKDRLGVEPLIAPEELIHPEIDEMSVMTYLSQFPTARPLNTGDSKPSLQQNGQEIVLPSVYGEIQDLAEQPIIKKPSHFTVLCSPGFNPSVAIAHESGSAVPVKLTEKEPGVYNGTFSPEYIGPHTARLRLENSSHGVVEPREEPYRFTAFPPARLCPYKDHATVGEPVEFRVEDAYNGPVDMIIVDSDGRETRIPVNEVHPGVHTCSFTPTSAGLHSVNVFYDKNHLDSSPFPLRVRNNIPDCIIWGRGIADSGIRVGEIVPVHIKIHEPLLSADPDLFSLLVKSKETENMVPTKSFISHADNTLTFSYAPTDLGVHEVQVLYDNHPVEKSYNVFVTPPSKSKVRAFGPGLEGGIAEKESVFQVDSNGEPGALSFSIEGPSKAEITCQEKGNGAALVSYTPKLPGVYKVKVLSGGEHIPESPFILDVQPAEPKFHPAAARVTGLDGPHVAQQKVAFNVDTKRTNVNDAPYVAVYDKDHNSIAHSLNEVTPCLYAVDFLPTKSGPYTVDCRLRGVALPGAPYTFDVKEPVDISKLRTYGPGVEGPVVAQEPTHFTIDAKQAGPGAVEVALLDRQGQNVDIDVLDHQDGSFTVKYTAPKPGAYQLNVVFAGEEMSPIEINVQPRVDVSGISVSGLENKPYFPGQKVKIAVHAAHLKPEEEGARIKIKDSQNTFDLPILEKNKGFYEAVYVPTHPGTVVAEVTYDKEFVTRAPIHVVAGCDPKKVVAHWKLLKELRVGVPAKFEIDTSDAGEGELSVSIEGPAECSCAIADNGDGTCTAKFTPTVPGKYEIGVKYGENKTHVPNSPFICQVDHSFNPESVYVSGLSHEVPSGEPLEFEVNAENTKDLPVSCIVPRGQQDPIVEKHGRIHKVRFIPRGESGESVPIQILYGGMPIKGSPFALKIARSSFPENVRILPSDSVNLHQVGQDATVVIDTRTCGKTKLLGVDVIGPDGRTRGCQVRPGSDEGLHRVVFVPDQSGPYKVKIFVDGVPANVDMTVNAVKFENDHPTSPTVNSMSSFIFKRTQTGEEITAKSLDPDAVDIAIVSRPDGDILTSDRVEITPKKPGPNTIIFSCGGKEFHRFSYECHPEAPRVSEPVEVYEHDYSPHLTNNNNYQPVYSSREFKFETDTSLDPDKLTAVVTMPSNKMTDTAEIIDNHDGSILVKYTPKTSGQHELSIFQEGKQVQGTPVKFFVDSYGDGYATVYGPGLQLATVGEPAAFTVCAKGSHAKELSVSIEGPAQSTIKIHDNKDGTCAVTWVPPVPGEYKVHVKLGNKEVRNSPFSVVVAGEGQKRSHLSVGSTSEVALNISQTELKGISASIKSPSGIEEPCFVRLIEGGRLGVSFTPREAGEHLITVKRDGKLLPKAPFKIKVGREQVGDASKVDVSGDGKSRAVCLQDNEILVDTSRAGFGGLSVSVQGPSKAELRCKEVKAGLIKVIYRPTEPGVYVIAIKFADHHVKDSPLTINCTGKGAGRVQQEISRRAEQANVCLPDHEGNIYLKLNNTSPMDITARIMDPKGKTEDVEMRDTGDQFYLIRFKPHIEGIHQLSVMHKDSHVNGSPLPFTVGSFGEGGAHKVRASGTGVIRGETNTVNTFNIYTREAGAGNLTVAIEGPAKATVQFQDHKDGNCHVDYKVGVAGEYTVAVKFNDQHIPDSPFKVFIAAATGEARKLELAQFHDNVPAGKAYTFTVLTHRAKGHLEAKVMGPSNDFETIDIVPIEEGESYALRFIPKESGNHYIHVTLDGAPMRDSPFRLRVGAKDLSDPTAISASGEGLIKGETGHKSEFIISTVNAGAGVLTCQVDGPSKVTLDAYELDLGYKVRFTPMAPGDYFAAVKYNGIHIPGSPFKIPINGKQLGGNGYNETSFVKIDANAKTSKGTVATVPEYKGDASKVVTKGAGLNKFFPGRPAVFTIDTGLAGTNLLMVGVVTTKGPCEEVIVKHQGNGHYVVNYKIHERVKGFIIIKYGDQEIPGSPFAIEP